MIIRTKNGKYHADNITLLDYLGIKKDRPGIQKVTADIELIAPVPFHLTAETENKGYAWTLSTYDLDRYSERIDPAGWDFSQFEKNPVVEWAHRYDIPAIGKIEGLTITDEGLLGFVYFNDKSYDPFAWSIEQRIKAGVLRAGSVGFRVIEIEIPDKEAAKDGTFLIFRKQELLEFSICNVPANPFALAKMSEKPEPTKELICPEYWGGLINKI